MDKVNTLILYHQDCHSPMVGIVCPKCNIKPDMQSTYFDEAPDDTPCPYKAYGTHPCLKPYGHGSPHLFEIEAAYLEKMKTEAINKTNDLAISKVKKSFHELLGTFGVKSLEEE